MVNFIGMMRMAYDGFLLSRHGEKRYFAVTESVSGERELYVQDEPFSTRFVRDMLESGYRFIDEGKVKGTSDTFRLRSGPSTDSFVDPETDETIAIEQGIVGLTDLSLHPILRHAEQHTVYRHNVSSDRASVSDFKMGFTLGSMLGYQEQKLRRAEILAHVDSRRASGPYISQNALYASHLEEVDDFPKVADDASLSERIGFALGEISFPKQVIKVVERIGHKIATRNID